MKEIELTQGKIALVDDGDFEWLNQYKWHAAKGGRTYYAVRKKKIDGKEQRLLMHRIILNTPKNKQSDHKDLNGLNNQRYNLRICTPQENMMNREYYTDGYSKFKGVSWDKARSKWRSYICINYKFIPLGRFISEIDAALAYDKACKRLFGEFARLNFK